MTKEMVHVGQAHESILKRLEKLGFNTKPIPTTCLRWGDNVEESVHYSLSCCIAGHSEDVVGAALYCIDAGANNAQKNYHVSGIKADEVAKWVYGNLPEYYSDFAVAIESHSIPYGPRLCLFTLL